MNLAKTVFQEQMSNPMVQLNSVRLFSGKMKNNGLTIVGEGNIVLKNVVSYSNLGFGGYLENSTAARPRNVNDNRFAIQS